MSETGATSRRSALKAGAMTALAFTVGGCTRELSPAEARRAGATFTKLTAHEVATLERLGEIIAPGSAEAGLAHYLDHQLSADAAEQMLMIRYLGPHPPYLDFYRAALESLDAAAVARHGGGFAALTHDAASALAADLAAGSIEPWNGQG